MDIIVAHDFNDFAHCIMIRTRVFVIEQNISAEIETDKWENDSTHPDRVFSSLGLMASNE